MRVSSEDDEEEEGDLKMDSGEDNEGGSKTAVEHQPSSSEVENPSLLSLPIDG